MTPASPCKAPAGLAGVCACAARALTARRGARRLLLACLSGGGQEDTGTISSMAASVSIMSSIIGKSGTPPWNSIL